MNDQKKFGFTTTILHSDRQKPIEHGSLHKPIHTAVAYGYRDARELAEHLARYEAGNLHALAIVHVPEPEQEQRRALSRQRTSFVNEIRWLGAMG